MWSWTCVTHTRNLHSVRENCQMKVQSIQQAIRFTICDIALNFKMNEVFLKLLFGETTFDVDSLSRV